jgi:GAF domain-containing protein
MLIVPDVEQFPGHIACNSRSKSEIVLPAFKDGQVYLVLDVDSDQIDAFDNTDEKYLSEIIQIIQKL